MPTGWRVTKAKYSSQGFSGLGALLYGGRWNSKGGAVVYTSDSLPLAILEILVHLPHPRHLRDRGAAPVEIPKALIESVGRLPRGWQKNIRITQRIGDKWLTSASSPVLEVPSTLYPCGEEKPLNYLLNPRHPLFAKLEIPRSRSLDVDPRIA